MIKKLQYGIYIIANLESYREALSDFKGNWLREDISVEDLGHTYKYPALLSFSVGNIDSEKLICNWTNLEYLRGVLYEV